MSRNSIAIRVVIASWLLLSVASATATEQSQAWNQWRGPARNGVGDASTLPVKLPSELTRVWQVPVGLGHASPVVVDDVVFLHSREGEQEIVSALGLADGIEMWRQGYDTPYMMHSAARSHGPGPKSTPIYADGRLFTFGITETLSAFNAATGKLLWQREFSDIYPETAPIYGTSMSPVVVDDKLVVHIGWEQEGAVAAFDIATGETRWSNNEFTPGYASPIVVQIAGIDVIVTQSDKHIIALEADGGATLWGMPFTTASRQNSVTPLAFGEKLIFSGLDEDLFAVSLGPSNPGQLVDSQVETSLQGTGDWKSNEIWRNKRLPLYMNSPVVVGNRLFGMTHKRAGQFICVDIETGEPIWASRGREGENASIVALGDRVVFLTDDARLVIINVTTDVYEPLVEYEVADTPTWAHPVFTSMGMLIKDLDSLTLWRF
jgi:outer membrane protein assembly factor BamB